MVNKTTYYSLSDDLQICIAQCLKPREIVTMEVASKKFKEFSDKKSGLIWKYVAISYGLSINKEKNQIVRFFKLCIAGITDTYNPQYSFIRDPFQKLSLITLNKDLPCFNFFFPPITTALETVSQLFMNQSLPLNDINMNRVIATFCRFRTGETFDTLEKFLFIAIGDAAESFDCRNGNIERFNKLIEELKASVVSQEKKTNLLQRLLTRLCYAELFEGKDYFEPAHYIRIILETNSVKPTEHDFHLAFNTLLSSNLKDEIARFKTIGYLSQYSQLERETIHLIFDRQKEIYWVKNMHEWRPWHGVGFESKIKELRQFLEQIKQKIKLLTSKPVASVSNSVTTSVSTSESHKKLVHVADLTSDSGELKLSWLNFLKTVSVDLRIFKAALQEFKTSTGLTINQKHEILDGVLLNLIGKSQTLENCYTIIFRTSNDKERAKIKKLTNPNIFPIIDSKYPIRMLSEIAQIFSWNALMSGLKYIGRLQELKTIIGPSIPQEKILSHPCIISDIEALLFYSSTTHKEIALKFLNEWKQKKGYEVIRKMIANSSPCKVPMDIDKILKDNPSK